MQVKKLAILGSTGSIGTQALQVIEKHSGRFKVSLLTAGTNADLLAEQAMKWIPEDVVIADESKYKELADALSSLSTRVHAGEKAVSAIIDRGRIDTVLTAMVGFSGLPPTYTAVKKGMDIALANKETLVVAGDLITRAARESGSGIFPVDSEHSAIFQCLTGEQPEDIEKVYLTASGGPFRGKSYDELKTVTAKEALKHPNWFMGSKVTIDSATLMNKGLETIEAKWLFNLDPGQIEVIVHPQSIIHSIVQFIDGSMKAQMGLPDMRLPIQYALGYPMRLQSDLERFSFMNYPKLTFELPDRDVFRCLDLALLAMRKGGNVACVINAANEIAVDAFLKEKIKLTDISEIIQKAADKIEFIAAPTLEDYINTNTEAREFSSGLLR